MNAAAEAFGLEEVMPNNDDRPSEVHAAPPDKTRGRRPRIEVRLPPSPSQMYGASPISERVLHSDRYMAEVRDKIPELLHHYWDFPNDYAEGGRVPHVVQLLRDMFGGGKLLAEWATDHAKSLTGTYFFPILSTMENPDEAHIIVGANLNDAKRRLQSVQRTLEGDSELSRRLIVDFPWLKQPAKAVGGITWSRTELTVSGRSANKPNPTLYACTTGSDDVRGRRGKLLMDDVESEKVRYSAAKRRELRDFIGFAASRCYEDRNESERPLAIALGTPMDNDSVYFWLEKQMEWKVSKLPAYTVDWRIIQAYAPPNLQSEWGREKFDELAKQVDPQGSLEERALKQRVWRMRGARIPEKYFAWPAKREKVLSQDPWFGKGMILKDFSLNFLLDPSAGDPTRLTLEEIERFCSEAELPDAQDWLTLVCFDPASGSESRQADYAGISVVRIRWPKEEGKPVKHPQLQVLEAHRFTQGVVEQVNFLADLAQQYNCKILYETNSQQGSVYSNLFRHHRPEVVLLPHYTSKEDKFDEREGLGLTVVRTLVRSQRLLVPGFRLETEGMQAFFREIRDLGSERSADHISMSVWFSIRYLWNQIKGYTAPKIVPVNVHSVRGGAMDWRNWRRG